MFDVGGKKKLVFLFLLIGGSSKGRANFSHALEFCLAAPGPNSQ